MLCCSLRTTFETMNIWKFLAGNLKNETVFQLMSTCKHMITLSRFYHNWKWNAAQTAYMQWTIECFQRGSVWQTKVHVPRGSYQQHATFKPYIVSNIIEFPLRCFEFFLNQNYCNSQLMTIILVRQAAILFPYTNLDAHIICFDCSELNDRTQYMRRRVGEKKVKIVRYESKFRWKHSQWFFQVDEKKPS